MKFIDWLKTMDTAGIHCNIYIYEDPDGFPPIYCGSLFSVPYWLAEYNIAPFNNRENKDKPIWWGTNLRETPDNEDGTPGYDGFVITLTEEDYNHEA